MICWRQTSLSLWWKLTTECLPRLSKRPVSRLFGQGEGHFKSFGPWFICCNLLSAASTASYLLNSLYVLNKSKSALFFFIVPSLKFKPSLQWSPNPFTAHSFYWAFISEMNTDRIVLLLKLTYWLLRCVWTLEIHFVWTILPGGNQVIEVCETNFLLVDFPCLLHLVFVTQMKLHGLR